MLVIDGGFKSSFFVDLNENNSRNFLKFSMCKHSTLNFAKKRNVKRNFIKNGGNIGTYFNT